MRPFTSLASCSRLLCCGIFLLLAASFQLVMAAPCRLVADINTQLSREQERPTGLTRVGGTLFMSATTVESGCELWKSDGTPEGTVLIREIEPGAASSNPEHLTDINGTLYFSAFDAAHGFELWKSDGTATGTVMVKDIHSGPEGSKPYGMYAVPGGLYFYADDGQHGRELWKSNGTPQGTFMVKDINPGPDSALEELGYSVLYPALLNGELFFKANDGVSGWELWKTNGTALGTTLVKDIAVGPQGSFPWQLVVFKNKLFFVVAEPTTGIEVWISDGTAPGTHIFKDLVSSTFGQGAQADNLTVVGNQLFFTGADDDDHRYVWKSDGTPEGTINLPTSSVIYYFNDVQRCGNLLYYCIDTASYSSELWRTDGTPTGTFRLLKSDGYDAYPLSSFADANGLFYFNYGYQLWCSDGSVAGTRLVKDFYVQNLYINQTPYFLTAMGNKLFLAGNDGTGYKLWKSDGTGAGTAPVKTFFTGTEQTYFDDMTPMGNKLFIHCNPRDNERLWVTDGSPTGTHQVSNLYLTPIRRESPGMAASGDSFYFKIYSALYKTNALGNGATLVRDLNPSYANSVGEMVDFNGTLIFSCTIDANNSKLFKSDGTYSGTTVVKNISVGSGSLTCGNYLKAGGLLYFNVRDHDHGWELWKTDGTDAGTMMIRDINPGAADAFSSSYQLASYGGHFYFRATDGVNGYELWKSDGSTSGTIMLKDIAPGPNGNSNPERFASVGGKLLFVANDGIHGVEPWISNGTSSGTQLLRDITPGLASSTDLRSIGSIEDAVCVSTGDVGYFCANDGVHGYELWKTDGTTSGTVMLKDISPRPGGSLPRQLTPYKNLLFFAATQESTGDELWVTDGTESGTRMVMDIQPGMDSSHPWLLTLVQDMLYFTAKEFAHGEELWSARLNAPPTPVLATEPAWTSGTQNTIFWRSADYATTCTLECSDKPAWTTPLKVFHVYADQGQTTVTGLKNGAKYYYRLRSTSFLGLASPWSALLASTQDAVLPQSQVTAPSGNQYYPLLTLKWTASDSGGSAASGLRNVQVYYRLGGGKPVLLGTYSPAVTSVQLNTRKLTNGGTFSFYSLATDQAGNVEKFSGYDTSVTIPRNAARGWESYQ